MNDLLSGDGSFGARGHVCTREAFVRGSDDVPACESVVCTGNKGLGFSVTKRKPRLLQQVLIFDKNKASFSCLQF